jgi:5,6-dimethylbenzimidazole synthase
MQCCPVFDPAFRRQLHVLLDWRRDVRAFRPDPVPDETLRRLIALACRAPSVGLSQPWRFVLVDDLARRAAIRRSFERCNAAALAEEAPDRAALYARLKLSGLDDAPIHLAVFTDPATRQGHELGRRTMPEMIEYSAVAAIHTLWLAARAEGIGMGWVSILDPNEVTAALDIVPSWKLIGYFCIGFPQGEDSIPLLERADWERRRPCASFVIRR